MTQQQMFIETGIEIPNRLTASGILDKLRSLGIGECVTLPAKTEEEQATLARRTNGNIVHARRTTGYKFTLRRMYGEVDGKLVPVVRVWRTADAD